MKLNGTRAEFLPGLWRVRRGFVFIVVAAAFGALTIPTDATAQTDRPPDKGGYTYSLGMPPVYKGDAAVMLGSYNPSGDGDLSALFAFGVHKDLVSPIVGAAAIGLEGYAGLRGKEADGGGRALFMIPVLHFTVGADYNVPDETFDLLLRLELALNRGGIFGRGTMVRIDYLPTRGNSIAAGIEIPLWGRNIGATRPKRDYVKLYRPPLREIELPERQATIDSSLANLRERATWLTQLATPLTDEGGKDPAEAYAVALASLQAHWDSTGPLFPRGHTLNEEIRVFHDELDRAFSMAAAGRAFADGESSPMGRAVSAKAREIMLDEVLFPYNRLLGQRKRPDNLDEFVATGHAEFARWVTAESGLQQGRWRETFFVFQSLLDIVEEIQGRQRERFEDTRFVWLPLQLGLKPEDHDTYDELEGIIERAVDENFTEGNHIWYVMNEEFQLEMARSVHRAEDYHVLWIHDYRGKNAEGNPDRLAFEHTVGSYLNAMTRRVREYDATGKLPQYFIFLDQHYFEINKGRLFLRVLSNPLDETISLPKGYEAWEQRLEAAQDSLRQAVAESRSLQIGASQYGQKWLRNQIKVHVNITNPSDFSFTSWHSVGIIPIPDNVMRDHRKLAFYDITEEDPYKGLAMYTGMGIGEHYAGPNWEDRAIMVKGPSALSIKDAARRLLENQGFEPDEIPFVFRPRPKLWDYDFRVDSMKQATMERWGAEPGRVMELHNETGFQQKPINVMKAVLYSLMPKGSVLKIPDSLWQSYIYASLLTGSALRGCKVLIFAPSLASAPSSAAPTMARQYGLMSSLVHYQNELKNAVEGEGGVLRIGLYTPKFGVGDLRGRLAQARESNRRFLTDIYPRNPASSAVMDSLDLILQEVGYHPDYLVAGDTTVSPKLHLKANFMMSREAIETILPRPEWGAIAREYIKYLARQAGSPEQRLGAQETPEELGRAVEALIRNTVANFPPEYQGRALAFLTVGSTNMDYRSMVMDGEVQITVTGWDALSGFIDFLILPGLTEWIETQERLNELLPPPSGFNRKVANLIKLML
jgi:hypothetical protein